MATLTFHGAACQVTGPCYLLEITHSCVLIECGLFQGLPKVDHLNHGSSPSECAIFIPSCCRTRTSTTRVSCHPSSVQVSQGELGPLTI